jgi:DNA (cytosine-5)-methyltransferase 1
VVARTQNVLSLCTGYGGLELGLELAGIETRTVCYVEREAYAAANLAALMQTGRVAQAPIWSDLTTFDGKPWRGTVDILTAGFPCQPHSVAGKRKGKEDERWLWRDIEHIIRDCEPKAVLIENVPGLLRSGLRDVLQGLARLGFDAVWTRRTAAEAGASHKRARLFVLAYTDRCDLRIQSGWSQRQGGQEAVQPARTSQDVGNPHGKGLEGRVRPLTPGSYKQFAWTPSPEDVEGWKEYIRQGGPEPAVCRGADGSTSRVDRLRLLGNGVCPPQAGLAIRELIQCMKEEA